MNFLQLTFFISILSITNAQWYIKKTYKTKLMNYPNPGKRNLREEQTSFFETDCSRPYSQLHSSRQKVAWIFTCIYKEPSSQIDENSLSSDSNNSDDELPSMTKLSVHENESPDVAPSYFTERNRFLTKRLQYMMKNKKK